MRMRINSKSYKIALHLNMRGVINRSEALVHYGVQNLPETIRQLRKKGMDIETVTQTDALGQSYTDYVLY